MDTTVRDGIYVDQSWPEWGVAYHWSDGKVIERQETAKGTCLEMVYRPRWGMSCYMNGEIQSCETDERLYHETLVHPAMLYVTSPRRVLVIGGGEGATAREVLKWPSVERVDMYEWDAEVVNCFQTRYRQWADGAWDDPRLVVHTEDIFTVVQPGRYPSDPYDVIIVDLFEPSSDSPMWTLFSRLASDWLVEGGSMAMYSGIRNHWRDVHPAEEWLNPTRLQEDEQQGIVIPRLLSHRVVYSYKVFMPSFLGEAMFLLLAPANHTPTWNTLAVSVRPPNQPNQPNQPNDGIQSHLTSERWISYHTWNIYPGLERVNTEDVAEGFDTEGVLHGV